MFWAIFPNVWVVRESGGGHHGYIWLHLPELFVLNRLLQGGFFLVSLCVCNAN